MQRLTCTSFGERLAAVFGQHAPAVCGRLSHFGLDTLQAQRQQRQKNVLVLDAMDAAVLDDVVDDADGPLHVGPGPIVGRQIDEVVEDQVEVGIEGFLVGEEERMKNVGDLAQHVDVGVVLEAKRFVRKRFVRN